MPEAAQARPVNASLTSVLEIAGVSQGYLQSFEGGSATSDVIVEKVGPDHIAHKHLAGVRYEDIAITVGTGTGKELLEWVKLVFAGGESRKDMAIKSADFNQNVISQLDILLALMTLVEFPELDASSKDAGYLTIKFSVGSTRLKPASGKLSQSSGSKAKQWVTSNFRLTIPGLDCTRVSKIGALSLSRPAASGLPDAAQVTGPQVPNLVVTLVEQAAQTFIDWHETFVIEGKNGQNQEKEGTLEILSTDLKEALFTLKFHGLGIFRLTPDKYDAGDQRIRTVTAEMYCETMEFAYGPGAVGSS